MHGVLLLFLFTNENKRKQKICKRIYFYKYAKQTHPYSGVFEVITNNKETMERIQSIL